MEIHLFSVLLNSSTPTESFHVIIKKKKKESEILTLKHYNFNSSNKTYMKLHENIKKGNI